MQPVDVQQNLFQFTTSQGGRLLLCLQCCIVPILSIHDLTRRSTRLTPEDQSEARPFNSRPHKEVDPHFPPRNTAFNSFNSRPHKEVDGENGQTSYLHILSIHDLTRRSTPTFLRQTPHLILSIHDLTRRSTQKTARQAICTSFQFTTSQGGRRLSKGSSSRDSEPFNSRPHKEVDYIL